jgi:hypothetical protein
MYYMSVGNKMDGCMGVGVNDVKGTTTHTAYELLKVPLTSSSLLLDVLFELMKGRRTTRKKRDMHSLHGCIVEERKEVDGHSISNIICM